MFSTATIVPARTVSAQRAKMPAVAVTFVDDTLPNGLRVLYHLDHTVPTIAVDVWYAVGSKYERAGRTGFAHLFEHLMFKGSRNVGDGQHWALLEAAGARGGADVNGTTNHDRTNFFETVPSHQLALALWLEADRMASLLDALTQGKLDNQREVVKNELRQGMEGDPYGKWYERVLARVFPPSHGYSHSIIGSVSDLDAATLDDVRQFFRTYYVPQNAVLVLAGDMQLNEAKRLVAKYFSSIPGGSRPSRPDMGIPPTIGMEQRAVFGIRNSQSPAVYVGYRMPAQRDRDGPAAVLLSLVLGGDRASPLYDSMVRHSNAAVDASAFNIWLVEGGDLATFTARAAAGASADSLERALLRGIDDAVERITEERLTAVRAQLQFQYVNGLQSLGGFAGRADRLAEGVVYFDNASWVNTRLERFARVTTNDLRALARERLIPNNRVTLIFDPTKPYVEGAR